MTGSQFWALISVLEKRNGLRTCAALKQGQHGRRDTLLPL